MIVNIGKPEFRATILAPGYLRSLIRRSDRILSESLVVTAPKETEYVVDSSGQRSFFDRETFTGNVLDRVTIPLNLPICIQRDKPDPAKLPKDIVNVVIECERDMISLWVTAGSLEDKVEAFCGP